MSFWEELLVNVDLQPCGSSFIIVVALYRVAILLGLMSDSAEDINESVTESTGCVVMSADVEAGHVEPEV